MKITTFILITVILQVSASTFAQKITLSEKNAPLINVLEKIRLQSGYDFMFSTKVLADANTVTINVKNTELKDALEQIFKSQPLTYKIEAQSVSISRKEPSFLDKLVGSVTADRFDLIDVKGKVVNQNNETLPGALIKIKGTNRAVIADANGNFAIQKVDDKAILVVSYIGYESQEVKAAPSMGYITLKPTTNALDQVVVQGYGTTTDRLRTGNIATVTKDIIEKQPVSNVLQALQGRVPGLIITQSNGYASAPFKVELRGRTAINPDMVVEPLYIIDGVPYDIQNIGGTGGIGGASSGVIQNGMGGPAGGQSPLFSINPNDIESISILKDADALAIYGSKGANGVILINTKKGQVGKTKFDAEASQGISMVTRHYNLMNTQQYVAMRKEAFKNSGIEPDQGNAFDFLVWDTTRYTNLQDLYWGDPAHRLDLEFGLSGGEKNTTFRMGGSLLNSKDVNAYSGGDKRLGFQLNLNHKNLNQRLNIALNTFYTYLYSDLIGLPGAVASAPNIPPIFNEQGKLNYIGYIPATYLFSFSSLLQPYNAKTNLLNANLKIQYQLAKGWNISTSFGYGSTSNSQQSQEPIASQNPELNPTGTLTVGANTRISIIVEPQTDYKLTIGKGELNVIAGATFQTATTKGNRIQGSGYVNDNLLESIANAPVIGSIADKHVQYHYSGVFARLNYNYQNKYIVNISGRRDGSTKFGPGKQFGNFGSAGIAWIFTEENLLKNTPSILSFGKLRASYGLTGSDNIQNYLFLSSWSHSGRSYQNMDPAYLVGRHFNTNLQWQTDKKLDIGINLGLFKDRVNLDLSYYRNHVGNQLVPYQLPFITGFGSVTANFPAVVQNTGFESTINASLLNSENWSWSAYFNIGLNRNKLVSFPGIEASPYNTSYIVGKPLYFRRMLKYVGVDTKIGEYTFEDVNGDGIINTSISDPNTSDMKVIMDLAPKFDGGFGSVFRYKGIQLDLSFHFRRQNIQKARGTAMPGLVNSNVSLEFLDRWQKPGDNARFARFTVVPTESDTNYIESDDMFMNTYFIRLNNAVISYEIPQKLLKSVGLRSAKIFAKGQNLFTITNYEGLDPETPIFGVMPTLSTFTGGLQLNF